VCDEVVDRLFSPQVSRLEVKGFLGQLLFLSVRESGWPVTTKAQQNADNADNAENAKVKSAILLGFLRKQ